MTKCLFCFKTTIIAVTENQKQNIDDIPVQKEKKALKIEEIDRKIDRYISGGQKKNAS